ncbi:MAG TPA: BatA and WFA domain-containing protein [Gemmatimonadaceae bacterium]|nr:BatA and WFA domain-containing protein [Gemmatimonadaceae bacterium]
MPLLAPLFLLGLAAVAVPLLVHLVQREKRDPMAFPSLMFLDRTPAPFTARRHLRDPWLFLLRALAVIALALAFARPVLGRRTDAVGVDKRRRELVVLIDRSFSMRIGDRMSRARAIVDSVIRTMAPGDRMTLVSFDRRAQALTPSTGDAAQLRAALAAVTLTDEATRLAPAITVAQQRLVASDAPRKALVVVSDLQRSAWDLTDDARMPAGTEIAAIDVAGTLPVSDRAVRSVDTRRASQAAGPEQVIVTARIGNAGPAVRSVIARLEVGGRQLEQRTVDLPRDGGASVTFAAVTMPPEPVAARVVLAADSLPGDDAFHFLLRQAPPLRVLLIESRPGPYLSRALGIGDAPRFEVTSRTPTRVTSGDLTGRQLVILADGAFPTGLGAAALLRFVEDGGGLITALGDGTDTRRWPDAARGLLPGEIQSTIDRLSARGAVLGAVDQRHPALALLSGARAGDLSAARFDRYRAIDTTAGVLASFDDGTAALTEHAVGRGRVLTFGSSLDGSWNDLPRQPAFLPLVQQLARYAASWRDAPRALEIGASVRPSDLSTTAAARATRWSVSAPSGARSTVGGDGAPAALELSEAGVHELRPGGSPGARPLLVAANIAPAELDFATFDALRLTTALTGLPGDSTAKIDPVEESIADREARQSAWWYLLLAAVLLLVAESIVARRSVTRTPIVE